MGEDSICGQLPIPDTHLFLACGAGSARWRGACTQSLLDVEVQTVQFSHQLAHGLRPGSLEQRRLLQDIQGRTEVKEGGGELLVYISHVHI